ncbi:hypothetical protein M9H77_22594 [Catharanthus roseus]|uniref:Uncharacterized protein n=1 Tax=Catharanthus roseus TaxID=4058 RepID=A0ACC0AUY7_CATRO|nr:hypothetical protein M9H77_22594 [Catharanthus roseus]
MNRGTGVKDLGEPRKTCICISCAKDTEDPCAEGTRAEAGVVATSSNRSIVLEGVAAAAEALVGKSNNSSRKGRGEPLVTEKESGFTISGSTPAVRLVLLSNLFAHRLIWFYVGKERV